MKTSSAILIVSVIIAATTGLLYERMDRLEARLRGTELALDTLEPLRNVMAGLRSQPSASPDAYQAIQATGAPNVPPDCEDHPNAWCPAKENGSLEWLQLTYSEPVSAKAIEIHANYNPGAVTDAMQVESGGRTITLPISPNHWKDQQRVTTVPLKEPRSIETLKLILDTSIIAGWHEIDAVGLVDDSGNRHWAIGAEASSAWSPGAQQPISAAPDAFP